MTASPPSCGRRSLHLALKPTVLSGTQAENRALHSAQSSMFSALEIYTGDDDNAVSNVYIAEMRTRRH